MAASMFGAGGAIVVCAAPVLGYFIRRRKKYKVNCWFCNQNAYVGYEQRKAFTCPHCEQYNGFDKDGDYDRQIPGQKAAMLTPKRYCIPNSPSMATPQNRQPARLCDRCNANMDEIRKLVGNFSPVNQNRFDAELAEYRYTLEQRYPLCPECTLLVHEKTEGDKVKYARLWAVRNAIVQKISQTIVGSENDNRKKRPRYLMGGGLFCEVMHSISFLLSVTLFVAQFHLLQDSFTEKVFSLPEFLLPFAPLVVGWAWPILTAIFFSHILAYKTNRCRVTLPDLLLPLLVLPFLLSYFLSFPSLSADDVLAFRCAANSSLVILTSAVTFVPRKRKHRKRPNRIINSAFSIASTPLSQCSTVDSSLETRTVRSIPAHVLSNIPNLRELTVSSDDESDKENEIPISSAPSVASSRFSSRSTWRERERSPTPASEDRMARMSRNGGRQMQKLMAEKRLMREESPQERMDWEDIDGRSELTDCVSTRQTIANRQKKSPIQGISGLIASRAREETPIRDLAPTLAGLNLRKDLASSSTLPSRAASTFSRMSMSRQSSPSINPFRSPSSASGISTANSRLRMRPLVTRISPSGSHSSRMTFTHTGTPTLFASSKLTTLSQKRPIQKRLNYGTDDEEESCFTSVSQRTPQDNDNRLTMMILIALVILLLVSQLTMIFYVIGQNKVQPVVSENQQQFSTKMEYSNWRREHYLVTASTFIGWYFSFLIIFVLPLDVSITYYNQCQLNYAKSRNMSIAEVSESACEQPDGYVNGDVLLRLWRIVYWTAQLLTWLVLPFMQSYVLAGDFSTSGRLRAALYSNTLDNLKVIIVSASNTWGLFVLVILLGYGLVDLPRSVWKYADLGYRLNKLYFNVEKLSTEKSEAEDKFKDVYRDSRTVLNLVKNDYEAQEKARIIVAEFPDNMIEEILPSRSGISFSSAKIEGMTIRMLQSEKFLISLHQRAIEAVQNYHRALTRWRYLIDKALLLEDIQKAVQTGNWMQVGEATHSSINRPWQRFWYTHLQSPIARVSGVCLILMSLLIVFSECTFFIVNPTISPSALIIQYAATRFHYKYTQFVAIGLICYLCACAYYTVFRLRIYKYYVLDSHGNTDAYSLLFAALLLCRLTPPICLNFLGMIHLDSHVTQVKNQGIETQFTKLMGHLDVIPVLGQGINIYLPICILILCAINYLRLGTLCLHNIGFEQFIEDDEFSMDMVGGGKSMVQLERNSRRRVVERENRRRHREEVVGRTMGKTRLPNSSDGEDRQSFLTDEERLAGEETKKRPTAIEIEKEKSQQQTAVGNLLGDLDYSSASLQPASSGSKQLPSNLFDDM
ncbi:hypothetical protein WR25_07459 isoform B [Diploscapter pachys]|nr:hypothetical protein WR25_07459 isoform B [Diploscapter pachys]